MIFTSGTNLPTSESSKDGEKWSERMPLRKIFNNRLDAVPASQNDEEERNERRSKAHLQKVSLGATTGEQQLSVGEHEIKDHIETCLKMFLENKITSKNAWNIKIIDYMKAFLKCNKAHRDTLQVGSTSLDVGAKVYGIRVDDVYTIGFKLASDMAKMEQKQRNDGYYEDADCPEKPDGTKKPLKKKRKLMLNDVKHTIAKDVGSLLCDPPTLDSGFFQTKPDNDLATLDNFLTNRISTDKSGCTFTLMNKGKLWIANDEDDPSLSDKTFNLNPATTDKISICPEFSNFEIDGWDPDNDEMMEQDTNKSKMNSELVFDEGGIPIAEIDGSLHDIFNEPDSVDLGENQEEHEENPLFREVENVNDLRPSNSVYSSEYTYRSILDQNKFINNIWAGPSHWKFKHIKRAMSKYSGVERIEKRVRMRKKCANDKNVIINFVEEEMPTTSEGNSLSKRNILLKPWPETNKFCFRVNREKVLNTLKSFLIKPSMSAHMRRYSVDHNHNESYNVAPYSYEDQNDSFYCPQNTDNDHHDDSADDEEEMSATERNRGYTSDNLIDLPETVVVKFVPYATRAKKMDMMKLKATIWKILVEDTNSDDITESMFNIKLKKPNTFSNVFNELPTILNTSMKEELSSPLAFIALLHLANERNLELTQQEDLADVRIEAACMS